MVIPLEILGKFCKESELNHLISILHRSMKEAKKIVMIKGKRLNMKERQMIIE